MKKNNPLEKYESPWQGLHPIYEMENKKKFDAINQWFTWLVVEPTPLKMMEFVSWDDEVPNWMET